MPGAKAFNKCFLWPIGADGIEDLGLSRSAAGELTEEQLLVASPLLLGFSLSDKLWRESFNPKHALFLEFAASLVSC